MDLSDRGVSTVLLFDESQCNLRRKKSCRSEAEQKSPVIVLNSHWVPDLLHDARRDAQGVTPSDSGRGY